MASGKVVEIFNGSPRTAVVQADGNGQTIYVVEQTEKPLATDMTISFELDAEGGVADSYAITSP